MSDEIKRLIGRLRFVPSAIGTEAADALEALAVEVEAYESARVTWAHHMRSWINRTTAAEAERDRLKAALEAMRSSMRSAVAERDRLKAALDKAGLFIANEYANDEDDHSGEWLALEARPIYAAICEALEAKE
jgi:hypothetical protein